MPSNTIIYHCFHLEEGEFYIAIITIIKLVKGRRGMDLFDSRDLLLLALVGKFKLIYNKWKMKTSNVYLRNEYYKDLSSSRFSSRTSRKIKSVAHRPDISDTKTVTPL